MTADTKNNVTYFARTTHRRQGRLFGIKTDDRFHHLYTIGKTGTGKSTMLKTMICQDIAGGRGVALFDPHGDLVESVASTVPLDRQGDLIYLNVADLMLNWHFNPFADIPKERRPLATAGIVETFKKLWPDEWGPRLEHLFRNVTLTLLELPGASLAMVPKLLHDADFRLQMVERLSDNVVQSFWLEEYDGYSPRFRAVVTAPLENKVGGFLADPILRRILSGSHNTFNLREVIDDGKILLVNLSKGRIGEGPASLLGSLLISSLSLVGLSRAESTEEDRQDFFVYLDEFYLFATLSLATMLSELRKYRVGLILAHQYFSQLDPSIRDAVLGNVGTLISFRIGAIDASVIARELSPEFTSDDLLSLPNFNIYLRLMIDAQVSKPFSAETVRCGDVGLEMDI